MSALLTSAQMRAAEQAAIQSGAVSGAELMEHAGAGVVAAIGRRWLEIELEAQRAIVLCGPGNNGGDGLVIARMLHGAGWEVEVFLLGDAERLPPDAALNHRRWCELGPVGLFTEAPQLSGGQGVLIDALFGTGLTRGLGPEIAEALARFEAPEFQDWQRVAVDVPSGLCADSGRVLTSGDGPGAMLRADLTVTFHSAKPGHFLAEGPGYCGALDVVDIGLEDTPCAGAAQLVTGPSVALSKSEGHKFGYGHALVLSGGFGRTGAARLAARAALRVGAGLVTLGAPGGAQMEVASQITALMLRRIEEAEDLTAMLEDGRLNALCLGPGLGIDRARALVPAALMAGRATVLDADALSAFAEAPEVLFSCLHQGCVLTPHGGEFARLFPDIAAGLSAPATKGPALSKLDAVRTAAARAGCTVLLKGADTVIAAPDGAASVHAAVYGRAAPWLATAGAGDVLAGLICGLMARGAEPMQAAETAAFLHVEAARRFGPGLIAEDLPEVLPQVLAEFAA
ncbi:bifunctional ADP-dependent (S)-NAD(P)H-hydrate dehydratase/NAD(P)H-hydrate epimerase [Salipiger sp. CCB-MM3]|uniref:bifunctional ADP-dependent NAD(P)H-hydrate dehydratase/NAD(P)H-hydrate epimerase n=1 Tax=Salipiger sp. CCB-MM3 TaxID=1792508 RepID=UPI00080ABF90|nr:bifunctional ADP-dependent NAD(P)H-hydrate dehydratase/NAD(P)H-hydrate epimerase [Salipiger sp. CCB-MM3]ANT61223.1 bifunctional ADP-dependent (S)-NAD(P)H-hydrate dehydratase/NAD(P)H-hydrate epimerase [Salipiger sp. CCB-MM3]